MDDHTLKTTTSSYKRKICMAKLHETCGWTVTKFCLEHYRSYNAILKRKGRKQPKRTVDKRLASNTMRVQAHASEWRNVYENRDPLVKRIAAALLSFRDSMGCFCRFRWWRGCGSYIYGWRRGRGRKWSDDQLTYGRIWVCT